MAFGDVVRSAASRSISPAGAGGDASTIWNCEAYLQKTLELKTSDFSVSRSATSPSDSPLGIGGDSATIWHCDGRDKVYELKTSDLSVSRSAASPSTEPYGIGGDSATIWHCDIANKVHELKTSDLSSSRSGASLAYTGIGGDSSAIWGCRTDADKVHEVKTSDFSSSRSAASPSSLPTGIGGDSATIWHCDGCDKIYELEVGIVAPTVTTQAVSNVEAATGTGNGNITDNGGEDCDKRGFVYNTSSHGDPGNTAPADSDYANYVEETDTFGVGAFTGALTSLKPSTIYYVRAYAHNSAGYSYGDEVSFRTKAKPTFRLDPKPRTRMRFHPILKLG